MRLALLAALAVACNPYDPHLGEQPFRCGTDEPRCPDGYQPNDLTVSYCICQRGGTLPDGGMYQCDDDGNEPNDSYTKATLTGVGSDPGKMYTFPGAVCPADDVDTYHLMAPRAGSLITVDVMFDVQRRAPDVDVLSNEGASLGPHESPTPMVGHVTKTLVTQVAGGPFFVEVKATQEVNYTVHISVTEPASAADAGP